jgi:hypothetical protein
MKRDEKDPLLRRIVSGVLVAVIPAMLAYVVSFVDGRRREELTYVNSQIEKLYGPLYALTQGNDVAWDQFVSVDWPVDKRRYFFDPTRPPTIEQVDKWRLWMTTVFQPLNVEMETRIINNSQLILGRQMPTAFKDLIAHTEAYKAVIATWKDSDRQDQRAYTSRFNNTVTGLNYPTSIRECVERVYDGLKERQEYLQKNIFSSLRPAPILPVAACDRGH